MTITTTDSDVFNVYFRNYSDERMLIRDPTHVFDRQNLSDHLHINAVTSKVKVVHMHSSNLNCDHIYIGRKVQSDLRLELTGSKTILNRASQGRFVYFIYQSRGLIDLFLSEAGSARHSVVLDRSFQSIKSIRDFSSSESRTNLALVFKTSTTDVFPDHDTKFTIIIRKAKQTFINLIHESCMMEVFGNFFLLGYATSVIKDNVDLDVPGYTVMQIFPDILGTVHLQTIQYSNIEYVDDSVLMLKLPVFNMRIQLPSCETHLVFNRMKRLVPGFQTLTMIKGENGGLSKTVVHLQKITEQYSKYQDHSNSTLELIVVPIEQSYSHKLSYMVHVALVMSNASLHLLDLNVMCQFENQLGSFVFLRSPHHHPSIITLTANNATNPTMQLMPIFFDSRSEFIILTDDFLERHLQIQIDKNVSEDDIKLVLVDGHLMILNQADSISILLVDFESSRSVYDTICLKFKNFSIDKLGDVSI